MDKSAAVAKQSASFAGSRAYSYNTLLGTKRASNEI